MAARPSQNFASSCLPATQSTAPVFEFRCLWTTDLIRKQKRWNDGFLNYHTFNKRVVVHDDQHNTVVESHWRRSEQPDAGDEATISEKAIVQIEELLGTKHTDLSQVVQPRKTRENQSAAARSSPFNPATGLQRDPLVPSQPKHKSLNALLGHRNGLAGKASLPTMSPFEERQNPLGEGLSENRAAKRQKIANTRYTVVRTSKPAKITRAEKTAPVRAQQPQQRPQRRAKKDIPGPSQGRLKVKEVIDIASDSCSEPGDSDSPNRVASALQGALSRTSDLDNAARLDSGHSILGPLIANANPLESQEEVLNPEAERPQPERQPQLNAKVHKRALRIGSTKRTKLLSCNNYEKLRSAHGPPVANESLDSRSNPLRNTPTGVSSQDIFIKEPENDNTQDRECFDRQPPPDHGTTHYAMVDDSRQDHESRDEFPKVTTVSNSVGDMSSPQPTQEKGVDESKPPELRTSASTSRSLLRSCSDMIPPSKNPPLTFKHTVSLKRSASDTVIDDFDSSDLLSSDFLDGGLGKPEPTGPWTDEALDLLEWRPPWHLKEDG